VEEILFHLFYLCIVNAHTLQKKNRKNILLMLFYKMVAEDLLSDAWQDTREWARSTSASRLNRGYQVLYRLPTAHTKRSISVNPQSVYRHGKA
jgi:hypothetical protein